MTNRVGLWIDHQKAVIVSISEKGESVSKIESGAKHLEYRGPTRTRNAYSTQYGKGDDQLDKQFEQQLHKYYAQVMTHLRGAESVLVFGPSEAKSELKHLIDRNKGLRCEVHAEPADRMTDRQVIARVRAFFASKPAAR